MTGNSAWWEAVHSYQQDHGIALYKEAESKCFHVLYERMFKEGMKQQDIRAHFETTFGLKYGAFYARLRRVL